ncbi:HpsJ family protein [Okeanomitos corallinicola TIOX110]|uniref:HpsJ family protein n=1 Tax=Okeanomitos corallinicola TIOX110 TaxID=3133117 RepID=A0ABZ2UXD4_9CYAN
MTAERPKKKSQDPLEVTEVIQNLSFPVFRLLGYALLIFSVIDYLAILIPPQLTNPSWEFQAISRMVDHVWSILLGLTFIFLYSKGNIIKPREITILKSLSWIALLVGIFYLLMLPLGINNSLTLYRSLNNQFINQQGQQQEQLQQVNERLKATNSLQELNTLARVLNIPAENIASQSTQELKTKLSQQIQKAADNSTATAKATKKSQVNSLIKNAVRINLGAILSAVFLIAIWNMTRWIRVIDKI